MGVTIKKPAPPKRTRMQLIALLLEDRLEPAIKFAPVAKSLLLDGFKGFNNMTDDELEVLVAEIDACSTPVQKTGDKSMLPVGVQ